MRHELCSEEHHEILQGMDSSYLSEGRLVCIPDTGYFDVPNKGETHLVAVAGDLKDEGDIRKVEAFNDAYRLKEKNAVLNWFDITEPEGYFSLNDKIGDIMATLKGKLLFLGLMAEMMPKKGEKVMGGFEMNDGMMSMLGGFTVLRLSDMIGTLGINLTKEDLLGLNAQLNKIKKPAK